MSARRANKAMRARWKSLETSINELLGVRLCNFFSSLSFSESSKSSKFSNSFDSLDCSLCEFTCSLCGFFEFVGSLVLRKLVIVARVLVPL